MNKVEMATQVKHLLGTFKLLKWFRILVYIYIYNYIDIGGKVDRTGMWSDFCGKWRYCHLLEKIKKQILKASEDFHLEINAEQLIC
jgi:hypothetical protein